MAVKRRVGILGGTFNPIHMGHLLMAEQAKDEFALDEVKFIPVGNPPHKDLSYTVPDAVRVTMTELAIQDNSAFSVDLFEIEKLGTCYTYETLQHFALQNPDTEYFFILGADSLFYFHEWRHPEDICKYSTVLVAVRDNRDMEAVLLKIEELNQLYQTCILCKCLLLHCPVLTSEGVFMRDSPFGIVFRSRWSSISGVIICIYKGNNNYSI